MRWSPWPPAPPACGSHCGELPLLGLSSTSKPSHKPLCWDTNTFGNGSETQLIPGLTILNLVLVTRIEQFRWGLATFPPFLLGHRGFPRFLWCGWAAASCTPGCFCKEHRVFQTLLLGNFLLFAPSYSLFAFVLFYFVSFKDKSHFTASKQTGYLRDYL